MAVHSSSLLGLSAADVPPSSLRLNPRVGLEWEGRKEGLHQLGLILHYRKMRIHLPITALELRLGFVKFVQFSRDTCEKVA